MFKLPYGNTTVASTAIHTHESFIDQLQNQSMISISAHESFTYIYHCTFLYDHKFDDYCELPYWKLFSTAVSLIQSVRGNQKLHIKDGGWKFELWIVGLLEGFWLIWYSTKRAYVIMICPSCIVVVRHQRRHRPALVSLASVHSPPSHRIQDRNFIFNMNMHMCPQYMHIKYLVILTCSF